MSILFGDLAEDLGIPTTAIIPGPTLNPSTGSPGDLGFGTDISTFPDLDPTFTPISGQRAVAECCARMLFTPRGSLVGAPDRGIDLRAYLNASIGPRTIDEIQHLVEGECEQDERVQSAACTVSFAPQTFALSITVQLTTALGPFTMTVSVNNLTLDILGAAT